MALGLRVRNIRRRIGAGGGAAVAVEVWSSKGGQWVCGGRGCRSTGKVIQVRELSLSFQFGLRSVSLAGVAMSRPIAMTEAGRRAGPMGQVVA